MGRKLGDGEASAIVQVVRCEQSRRIQNPGTCDPRMSVAGFIAGERACTVASWARHLEEHKEDSEMDS
jgi:hypothetical protein